MRRVLLLPVAAGLLAVLVVGFRLILGGLFLGPGSCSEEERKVYAEFPSTAA